MHLSKDIPASRSAIQIRKNIGRLAYATRDTDQLGHCRVATGSDRSAILAEGRSDGVLAAVLVLDIETMLEELEVKYQNCHFRRTVQSFKEYAPQNHVHPLRKPS